VWPSVGIVPLDATTLRRVLPDCLAVPRWVDEIAAGAPYPDDDALLAAAADAGGARLTDGEVDAALARHPRIGERPEGSGRDAAFSRAEQASADADDTALAERIAAGNRRYEERFDRVFLIRAKGRSRAEIVAELDRRLTLDDVAELEIVKSELTQIALLRLRTLLGADQADEDQADEDQADEDQADEDQADEDQARTHTAGRIAGDATPAGVPVADTTGSTA